MIIKELFSKSYRLAQEAEQYIAGGAASLNRKVTPDIVFNRGIGSKICDVDGNEYIDYHAAFGPHLLGHNNQKVNKAVYDILLNEWSLIGSGTNELEIKLAKLLCKAIDSLELVQITNTGSEAVSLAIRLSRAYTEREDIILMLGGYNGWHNDVCRMVMPSRKEIGKRIRQGEYPFLPLSAGVPNSTKGNVHIVNFNDLESVEVILKRFPVACVLTEPVLQNIGVVLPAPGYLQGLIDLCDKYGAICVFDEVKTGFRSALGGYQSIADVKPHLSVFGKAVANGYPLGIVGGRREIMQLCNKNTDTTKRVFFAGTYNAHPVNTAAAIATLECLENPEVYEKIASISSRLYNGLEGIFKEAGVDTVLSRNASAFCVYFCEKAPNDVHDILENVDFNFDLKYRRAHIQKGIYYFPIACKQCSVSYAHSEEDIDRTLDVTRSILKQI